MSYGNSPSLRRASPDYLTTLNRIVSGQLPFASDEDEDQTQNAFAPMPPPAQAQKPQGGVQGGPQGGPQAQQAMVPLAGSAAEHTPIPALTPDDLAGAMHSPPAPPDTGQGGYPTSMQGAGAATNPVEDRINQLLNAQYNYMPIPGFHVRDLAGEGKRGLVSALAGLVGGGILGGARGALTGFGGAGQGAIAGGQEAAQLQAQQDAMAQQRAMAHNQMERYQQMYDTQELGRLAQLQRAGEMNRKDTIAAQNQLTLGLMNMSPEDQQAYLKSPIGQSRLSELGLPASVDAQGNINIPNITKASNGIAQERADTAKAALTAKQATSFRQAWNDLSTLSPQARQAMAPVIAKMYPEIGDQIPDLISRLGQAEKQPKPLPGGVTPEQAAWNQKVKTVLLPQLNKIISEGNDANLARANQLLHAINPGATPFTTIAKPVTPAEQETMRHNRAMEGIAGQNAARAAANSALPAQEFAYRQQRDAANDATKANLQAIGQKAKQRDDILAERDRLDSALRTGTYTAKGGQTQQINDADRATIRQRVLGMEAQARSLDHYVTAHGGTGAPRPYLPDAPATVDAQAAAKTTVQPGTPKVGGTPPPQAPPHPTSPGRDVTGKFNGQPAGARLTPAQIDALTPAQKAARLAYLLSQKKP